VVAVAWLEQVYHAVHNGMTDSDTLWYHLPYAARWVQEGSLTGLHFTSYEPLTTFYPSTPGILHAVGMLSFGNEALSPFVNLGWLALALTAGWAIGRPYAAAPATLLGAAVVMGVPMMVGMQAGSAKDDAAGVALVLSAVALLVNHRAAAGERERPRVAPAVWLAGLATGLLIGVKLSTIAPAVLLAVAVVLAARRGARLATAGAMAAMLFVGGSFWYLRNLGGTGNPTPYVELDLGPIHLPSPELAPYTERYVTGSGLDYVFDPGFVDTYLEPSFRGAFGPVWWATLGLALFGALAAVLAGRNLLHRALGAAAVLMAVAVVVTPGGAGGSPDGVPHLLFWSMRYVTPAMAVGLVLLPLLPHVRARAIWPTAAFALALFGTQFAEGGFALWDARPPIAVLLLPVLAAAALLLARSRLRTATVVVALALLAGGWKAQDIYFTDGYRDPNNPLRDAFRLGRDVKDSRIGIVGFYLQSPLYGEDLSNHVQYVGHSGGDGNWRSVASCAEWRAELAAGDYDYVVTAPFNFPWGASNAYPREARWTETDPSARRIADDGPVAIFALNGDPDPSTCASDGFPASGDGESDEETGPARPEA
jgi:hypothetical protein